MIAPLFISVEEDLFAHSCTTDFSGLLFKALIWFSDLKARLSLRPLAWRHCDFSALFTSNIHLRPNKRLGFPLQFRTCRFL